MTDITTSNDQDPQVIIAQIQNDLIRNERKGEREEKGKDECIPVEQRKDARNISTTCLVDV
jgi:hypothetical protein